MCMMYLCSLPPLTRTSSKAGTKNFFRLENALTGFPKPTFGQQYPDVQLIWENQKTQPIRMIQEWILGSITCSTPASTGKSLRIPRGWENAHSFTSDPRTCNLNYWKNSIEVIWSYRLKPIFLPKLQCNIHTDTMSRKSLIYQGLPSPSGVSLPNSMQVTTWSLELVAVKTDAMKKLGPAWWLGWCCTKWWANVPFALG